jgi:hypothetical protein
VRTAALRRRTHASGLCAQVALFCIGAQSAIVAVLRLGLSAVAPRAAQHTVLLPWRGGRRIAAPTCVLVFVPLSAALAVLWGLHRGAPWAWAYQVPLQTSPAGRI